MLYFTLFICCISIAFSVVVSISYLKLQSKLKQQNDYYLQLLHDIKSPVSTTSVALDLLQNAFTKSDKLLITKYLNILTTENRRTIYLLENSLDADRIGSSKSNLNFERLNLHEILLDCIDKSKVLLDLKNGSISTSFLKSELTIIGDKRLLSSSFLLLIENAIRYSSNPLIVIKTEVQSKQIFITISDNGIGIEKAEWSKIFQKYYRSNSINSSNDWGYGLGLYFVKQCMIKHLGNISVESNPGIGTDMIINLPFQVK